MNATILPHIASLWLQNISCFGYQVTILLFKHGHLSIKEDVVDHSCSLILLSTAPTKVFSPTKHHNIQATILWLLFRFNFSHLNIGITEEASTSLEKKKAWSKEEIEIVLKAFHTHVVGSSLPGKNECLQLITKLACLRGRKWTNLKDYIRNHKVTIARWNNNQNETFL